MPKTFYKAREQGYREGYEEGYKKGLEEGRAMGKEEYTSIGKANSAKEEYENAKYVISIGEQDMVRLAIDIARKIID